MVRDLNDELSAQLSAYLDDALDAGERAAVEAQLAERPEARALLEELRQVKSLVAGLPRASAPDDLVESLAEHVERQALLGDPEPLRVPVERRPWQVGKLLATAAVFAIVCTAGVIVMMQLDSSEAPVTTVALIEPDEAPSEAQAPRALEPTRAEPRPAAPGIESALSEPEIEARPAETGQADGATPPAPITTGSDLTLTDGRDAEDERATVPARRDAQGLTQLARRLGDRVGGVLRGLQPTTRAALSKDRTADALENRDGASLTEKVEAGMPMQALASHRFETESVRLELATATAEDRVQVDQQIQTFFANNGIVAADTLPPESAVARTQAFYLAGPQDTASRHSTPGDESSRAYAVRLAPTQLTALLGELQSGGPGQARLQALRVGPAVSQDWASATRLAEMIAPAPDADEDTLATATTEMRRPHIEAGEREALGERAARRSGRANVEAPDGDAFSFSVRAGAGGATESTPEIAQGEPSRQLREEPLDDEVARARRGRSRTPQSGAERPALQTATQKRPREEEALEVVKAADKVSAVALDLAAPVQAPVAGASALNVASAASRPTSALGREASLERQRNTRAGGSAGLGEAVAQDPLVRHGAPRAKAASATAPGQQSVRLLTVVLALHGPPATTAPTSLPAAGRPLSTTRPDAP